MEQSSDAGSRRARRPSHGSLGAPNSLSPNEIRRMRGQGGGRSIEFQMLSDRLADMLTERLVVEITNGEAEPPFGNGPYLMGHDYGLEGEARCSRESTISEGYSRRFVEVRGRMVTLGMVWL